MKLAMFMGCGNTMGCGVDLADSYVNIVAQHYNVQVINPSCWAANYTDYLNAILEYHIQPLDFVVMQWSAAERQTIWHGIDAVREHPSDHGAIYDQLLELSPKNFYEPWLQSIRAVNLICELEKIPIINFCLDQISDEYLNKLKDLNITMHLDEKLPGRSWLFDNATNNGLHHSAHCQRQWAERLIGIIDEVTSR